jgi:hypothetical protein
MQVTRISLGHSSEQFKFLNELIKLLTDANERLTVYFPDVECLREAEVVCEEVMDLESMYDFFPAGLFTFKSTAAGSQMAYQVKVQLVDDTPRLRVTMCPGKGLNKKVFKPSTSTVTSYAAVLQKIHDNFLRGAPYRIIKPMAVNKTTKQEQESV